MYLQFFKYEFVLVTKFKNYYLILFSLNLVRTIRKHEKQYFPVF